MGWQKSSIVCRYSLRPRAELKEVGDYKAMEAAGIQVLITRTQSGEIKAFVNMCSHRGARLMNDGCGTAHRFTCPLPCLDV